MRPAGAAHTNGASSGLHPGQGAMTDHFSGAQSLCGCNQSTRTRSPQLATVSLFPDIHISCQNGATGALLGLAAFTLSPVTRVSPNQAPLKHATQRAGEPVVRGLDVTLCSSCSEIWLPQGPRNCLLTVPGRASRAPVPCLQRLEVSRTVHLQSRTSSGTLWKGALLS